MSARRIIIRIAAPVIRRDAIAPALTRVRERLACLRRIGPAASPSSSGASRCERVAQWGPLTGASILPAAMDNWGTGRTKTRYAADLQRCRLGQPHARNFHPASRSLSPRRQPQTVSQCQEDIGRESMLTTMTMNPISRNGFATSLMQGRGRIHKSNNGSPTMKTKLTEHLDQLSPLLDSVIARIDSFGLPAFEVVNLSAQAMLRIAIGTQISVAQAADGGRALTPEERDQLMDLLIDSKRKSDAALMAALDRHGARVQ